MNDNYQVLKFCSFALFFFLKKNLSSTECSAEGLLPTHESIALVSQISQCSSLSFRHGVRLTQISNQINLSRLSTLKKGGLYIFSLVRVLMYDYKRESFETIHFV